MGYHWSWTQADSLLSAKSSILIPVGVWSPCREGSVPLVLSFTQAHLYDTPFCNVSRDKCAIPHKSRDKRERERERESSSIPSLQASRYMKRIAAGPPSAKERGAGTFLPYLRVVDANCIACNYPLIKRESLTQCNKNTCFCINYVLPWCMMPSSIGSMLTPLRLLHRLVMAVARRTAPEAPQAWGFHLSQTTAQCAAPILHVACLSAWQMHAACGCLL